MNSKTKFIPDYVPSRQEMMDFVNEKLSAEDMLAVQQLSANDPFIADAIEGLQMEGITPSLERIDQHFAAQTKSSSWGNSYTLISLGLALGIVAAIMWWSTKDETTSPALAANQEQALELEIDRNAEDITEANGAIAEPQPSEPHVAAHKTTDSSISITISHVEGTPLATYDPYLNVVPLKEVTPDPVKFAVEGEILPKRNSERIYHIEDYKVVDYRGKRSEEFKQWKIAPGGVPANLENSNQNTRPDHEYMTIVAVQYVDYLEEAIVLFSVGKFKDCDKRMRTILKKYPDDINAQFYLGLSLFNSQKYDEAKAYFSALKILGSATFEQEIDFYLAKSMCQSGEKEAGKTLLQAIANGSSFYARQAQHLLEELN
jgi:TolA-binding protein